MSSSFRLWRDFFFANATVAGGQTSGTIAPTGQNDFFAAWVDQDNYNGGFPVIAARHFDTAGNPLTGEIVLSPPNQGAGHFVAVDSHAVRLPIAGSDDGVAIAFVEQNVLDVHVVRTNSNLVALESDIPVETAAAAFHPEITSFSNGRLAVAFTVQNSATDHDISMRFVEINGTVSAPVSVFNDTDISDNVDLATLSNGSVVVVFQNEFGGDSNNDDIRFAIFTGSGATVAAPTFVAGAADISDEQFAHVAALAGGGFVVAWEDSVGDASGSGIRASIYDSLGNLVRGNFLVNGIAPSRETANQREADVAALPDGGFVVSFRDLAQNLVYVQRFDSDGDALGAPVSTTQAPNNTVATLSDGRVLVTRSFTDVQVGIYSEDSVRSDFNGDFTSDLLWSNGAQGALGVWRMQNGQIFQTVALNHDMPGWQGLSGDFTGDGTADLLWRNPNGVLGVWRMQDNVIFQTIALNHDMPGWTPLSGDFNGDGTTDLLWNNGQQGVLGVWQMGDGSIFQTIALNHNMPGWTALAGDFNGDGTTDLLWNSGVAGILGVWTMQDSLIFQTTALNHDMPGWTAAAGDFNGDGTTDLLWNNGAQGVLGVWEMRNGAIFQTIALNHDMPGWSLAATGDFNHDSTTDLLWSNANGVLGLWLMQDGHIGQTIAVNHDMPGWNVIQ